MAPRTLSRPRPPDAASDLDAEARRERLRWLVQLRFGVIVGALLGAILAVAWDWKFVSAPAIAAGVLAGVFVNGVLLWRARSGHQVGPGELSLHVVADLFALTWLLAFSGGLQNPLSVIFSFHVVLGTLLSGQRGALVATAGTALCVAFLFALERLDLLPTEPLERPPALLSLAALMLLVGGLSYFALVLDERLRDERRVALSTREQAVQNLRLFENALDALKVGLEVVEPDGTVRVKNSFARRFQELPMVEDAALAPKARSGDGVKVARFAVSEPASGKRIIDQVTLFPTEDRPLGAVLYVDRTEELLVEQRHVMLERLATLGRALQGIAHELNTPLMTLQTLAKDLVAALDELPLDGEARVDLSESLELIVEEARRMGGLTQSLLSTAHEGARPSVPGQSALSVARRAVQLVGARAERGDVWLDEASLDRPLPVSGDRVLQVLMNLVQNALQATEGQPGGAPRVRVSAGEEGGALFLDVEDTGPGLPDEVRARLFEPFVTTRAKSGGTGLGLYVSHTIARELGGDLLLQGAEGGGTRARLVLPLPPIRSTPRGRRDRKERWRTSSWSTTIPA